jgi:glucose/arabinose dehydrogenase
MRNKALVAALSAIVVTAGISLARLGAQQPGQGVETRPPNAQGQTPAFNGQTRAPERKSNVAYEVTTVLEGLQNPWGLAFLPNGKMLLTERAGRLRVVTPDGKMSEPVAGLPKMDARGQGGLLDVVLDPAFAKTNLIYWSFSEPQEDGTNNTAAARGRFVDDATAPRVENVQVIFHQTPSLRSNAHFGSRLVFGRDGTLFITMGDRSATPGRMQAQNLDSLIGKVARINPDGSIPKDNPFVGKEGAKPEIWSIGHRNIQGATLHPTTGELWTNEHGTRGGDEINIARKGKDYGWPTIAYGIEYNGQPILEGITAKSGMEQPVYYWDPVIAPGNMIFYTGSQFPQWKGSLLVCGLLGQHVARLVVEDDKVLGEERLLTDLQPAQRCRDIRQGPDGALYVLTDHPRNQKDPVTGGKLLKIAAKR